jgi:flavin-dependent dehydrogenase
MEGKHMKILVAGAGHGGLVAAGLLAQKGHDVTVFERNPEQNLGYDWTDIFTLKSLSEAGIPLPPAHECEVACEMTFFNPSYKTAIHAYMPPEKSTEYRMERRDLLRHLIAFARNSGVKLLFETTVKEPLILNNRVIGLVASDASGRQEAYGDLIIDAAGMESPVRTQLPAAFGITKTFDRMDYFTVCRTFFRSTGAEKPQYPFNVYFFPLGRKAIAWVASEHDDVCEYVDLLCGSFEDTTPVYAEQVRQFYVPRHPDMGNVIYRGGQVAKIPVRRSISVMVADGYAAVGDAAAMTVPLNGSGLTASIRAGRILAETVLASGGDCTAAQLWPFQAEFMRRHGAELASLDPMKRYMLSMTSDSLNFLFDKRILTAPEMNRVRIGREISFTLPQLLVRGLRGASKPPAMLSLAKAYFTARKLKRHAMNIPEVYDANAVRAWAKKYDGIG